MSGYIEDHLPIVKEQGLNTVKNVDFSGATTVALPAGTTIAGTTAAGVTTITSTSASALTVGRQGATDPVLKINANTGSVISGIEITGAATGNGATIASIGGTSEPLALNAKGSGTIAIGAGASNGIVTITPATVVTGALTTTAAIINDSTTDTTSGTTGAIQTDGGVGIAKALYVGTTSTLSGAVNYKKQVTDTGGAYATAVVLTEAQSGRVIIVDDAAGLDFTLPALGAAQVGTHFKFIVTVTVSSNNFRVTALTGDILFGGVIMTDFDTADKILWCPADGSNDLVMTMNGSTTGGKMGTWVEFIATGANQWCVTGVVIGDGTLATPFT